VTVDGQKKETIRQTEALLHWASNFCMEDIPDPVLRKAVLVLGDELGAMVASRNEPEVRCIQNQFFQNSTVSEATVFRGGRERTDRYSAAPANAAAANWCELDGGYRKTACHAGLYALPALLAEAESEGIIFGEVLKSLIVSYEVVTRLARGWQAPSMTLHPHAIFASVGAATAVAAARRLDRKCFSNAVTAAATLITVGPYGHAVKGALIENMWAASAAWNGMRSVDWAQCEIGGLESTLYDVYSSALGFETHLEQFTAELGKKWAICDGYHKLFACCQYAHSTVEATLMALAEMPPDKGVMDIKYIVVETHELGLTLNNYNPETTLAARFSIPHIVAATLCFGHAEIEAFSSTALTVPEIKRIRKAVELRKFDPEKPMLHDRPARVTIEFNDGSRLVKECLSARGGPDRPFSEADILEKISRYTKDVYPSMASMVSKFLTIDEKYIDTTWDEHIDNLLEK